MSDIQFIPYEVPLTPGAPRAECARLVLPADLTREQADRIIKFIDSLAFEPGEQPVTP